MSARRLSLNACRPRAKPSAAASFTMFCTEAIMELNELFASERISFFAGCLMLLACWAMDYCTGGDDWQ